VNSFVFPCLHLFLRSAPEFSAELVYEGRSAGFLGSGSMQFKVDMLGVGIKLLLANLTKIRVGDSHEYVLEALH